MITKTSATITNLKNLFIEMFLDKTAKVSNVADGSVVNATAFGVAKVAQKAMKDIAIKEAQIFPDSATGEYLDKAAALYGVSPRKGALGSSTYIRVSADPGTVYDTTVTFVSKNGIRFQVDESLTVGESGYGYVKVRSVNAGYTTNVAPNSITNVNPQLQGHIECTNEYYAVGGRDSEDDETFRVRIKNNLNVLSKGTIEYFTQIFQNLDDRVLKVMNVGLDEKGYFVLYIVAQNGIYFTESELETLLNQSQEYFGLSELNLNGEVTGIVLKNAEWFYVGSERGMDFRLNLVPGYDVATVRKNIQVALTKYLDFRFWKAGQVVEWDDLFDIVKKSEGVKYVPDQYFFPYYDEQVPINQLPRIRGFVMRDANGNILYDSDSTLSPTFYPQDSEDIFRGLSDNSLPLSQQVYFTVVDEYGNPVEGARISAGNNIIITDANGQATLSLVNGSYNYSITKKNYETINGSFVVLNSSVSISATLNLAPWTVTFTVRDEKDSLVQNATIAVGGKTATTNSNGVATMNLKNGTYSYTITKLGYDQITGKSFTVNDSDISISETMYFYAWQTTFVILSEADSKPIPSAIIEIGNNSYITNSQGQVTVPLINGTYNLTIKKVGYQETKKTIVILNQDTTITYTMPLFEYNVVMTVVQEDGLTPIVGAAFSIKNSSVSGITDPNGQLSFKLVNGSYDYLLTKKEFDDLSGSFNINNSDLDLELTMTLKHFTVLISAVDENGDPVENALVNINNEVLTTNDQGQVTALLQNGNYPFTITKIGYNDYTGNVVVTDQNTSIVANMTFYLWQILFTIKGKNNLPLNNASLNIYGQTYQSDENGQIEVRLKNGTYPYSITYLGYDDYQSNLVVLNKNESIDVLMQEKTYAVTFSVTGLGGIALQGVTITVGDKSTTTNEGGIATLSLVNGSYSYTTNKDGYVTSSGDFTVNNAEVPISVNMTPMSYNVVFKVKDDNTTTPNLLANVQIQIDGQTLSTNNQGEVSLRIYGGDYVVSYTLAGYVQATQEISIVKDGTFEQVLKKIWNLIFSVVAATKEPLIGATVRVQGSTIIGGEKTLTTKADGTTDPIEITNGQYTYGASMEGYSPEEGSGEIKDADKTQTVDLVFGFETTFIAKEGETPIQGVSIIVDSVNILTTGIDGTAKLNLSNGQHTYTYTKDGYISGSGNITVTGTTQSIDITLIAGGLVTFTAVYNENPLAGVEIIINNTTRALPQTITTNSSGIATIELPNNTYEYTTHIEGYEDVGPTTFTVNSTNLPISFDLTPYKYFTVDFTTSPAVEGVTIRIMQGVDGFNLTTDSQGKASTQLLPGSYTFTTTKDKYMGTSGEFAIELSNKSITIPMVSLSTVTFTVKDQSDSTPIVGATVRMTGTTNPNNIYVGITNASGVATMAIDPSVGSYVGVLYDTYNYTVTPPSPYQSTSGTLEVNTAAINKEVLLIGNYDVTFNVKGKRKREFIFRPQIGDFVYSDKTWSRILNPNKTCVGVITDVRSRDFDFVALNYLGTAQRSTVNTLVTNIVTTTVATEANLDFKGKYNTEQWVSQIGINNLPAFKLCLEYGIGDFGAGQWYLPAAGQLIQFGYKYSDINSKIVQAGGQGLTELYALTSTQYDTTQAWSWRSDNNDLLSSAKSNVNNVRPFCTYEYNPIPNGIYIYDKNGDYFTKEQWTAAGKVNADAIGVGVVTDSAQFIISTTENSSNPQWGGYGTISNIVTTTDAATAKKDYLGSGNTDKIIAQLGSGNAPAADYCRGVTFKHGKKGYLGSLGEWQEAYNNKAEIDACMSLIGGTAINTSYYHWTSTQYSSDTSWGLNWSDGSVSFSNKKLNYRVRAFTDLIIYDIVPLENAIITPDNDSSKQVTTNAQGQAVISLKAGIDHDYSIQAEGYVTREGTTGVLTGPITLDWTLNIATDFTFVLRADTESGPFIKGASIHVTSVEGSLIPIDITKETDTAGIAIFSLAEGTYDVVITAPNYKFEPLYNISVQDNVPGTLSIVGTGSYDLNVTVNRNNVGAANRTINLYSTIMSQDTVLGEILSEMGCVLFKRTGDKAGTFIRLDKNTRLKYFDGSPAKTDGTEGDVMVYMPEYYYKYENLGGTKFAYRFSRVSLGDDWIHVPASLIGAYKCYCTDGKMYSRSGVNPTARTTWTNFNNYAIARGTGYQMIDYWQHCQIAMLFYAKYKNRNSQAVLGVGSASYGPITTAGGTDNLGNNDTQQTTSGWVNFQGIEGVHGGAWECVGGVSISNRVWTITNPDGTTRTINAGTSDGWITKMALENGPYFDMVPTAVGGSSDSIYYSDYYWQTSGDRVLWRSFYSTLTYGGVACACALYMASESNPDIGSRLAFRGVLTESKSVSDYAAITAV